MNEFLKSCLNSLPNSFPTIGNRLKMQLSICKEKEQYKMPFQRLYNICRPFGIACYAVSRMIFLFSSSKQKKHFHSLSFLTNYFLNISSTISTFNINNDLQMSHVEHNVVNINVYQDLEIIDDGYYLEMIYVDHGEEMIDA